MMWSSRAPVRSSRASAQSIQQPFQAEETISPLRKGSWKTYKIDVKKIKLLGHVELNAKESDVSGSVGKHLQDQVPCLVSGSPWEVSFHVKSIWHTWSAPYALILDHRGHLHIHRLYNNREETRPDRVFVCELWDLVSKSQLFFYMPRQTQDIWPNSSLAYKLWICIAH